MTRPDPALPPQRAAPSAEPLLAIDFEASCLPWHGRSFPIEVGIADTRGHARAWLIRPQPHWQAWTWTAEAEALHGLTRARLLRDGQPASLVAAQLAEAVAGHRLVADSELDSGWMRLLMDAAPAGPGQAGPRPAVGHVVDLIGALGLDNDAVRACIAQLDAEALPRHRAAHDARWLGLLIGRLQRAAAPPAPAARDGAAVSRSPAGPL